MKNQHLKEHNLLPRIAEPSLIAECNDFCENLKTYFLLPFIALNSARTHYYTAVHI